MPRQAREGGWTPATHMRESSPSASIETFETRAIFRPHGNGNWQGLFFHRKQKALSQVSLGLIGKHFWGWTGALKELALCYSNHTGQGFNTGKPASLFTKRHFFSADILSCFLFMIRCSFLTSLTSTEEWTSSKQMGLQSKRVNRSLDELSRLFGWGLLSSPTKLSTEQENSWFCYNDRLCRRMWAAQVDLAWTNFPGVRVDQPSISYCLSLLNRGDLANEKNIIMMAFDITCPSHTLIEGSRMCYLLPQPNELWTGKVHLL